RTLPGALPATGLHFGVAKRPLRATLMRFEVSLLGSFRSLFPLCVVLAWGLSSACSAWPRTVPWTLLAARNAMQGADFIPLDGSRQRRRNRSRTVSPNCLKTRGNQVAEGVRRTSVVKKRFFLFYRR